MKYEILYNQPNTICQEKYFGRNKLYLRIQFAYRKASLPYQGYTMLSEPSGTEVASTNQHQTLSSQ